MGDAGDHHSVEGAVRLAVAASAEPVADRLAGGCRDRRYAAQSFPRSFAVKPFGVVTGGDEKPAGRLEADAEHAEQAWCGGGDERLQRGVELSCLGLE